ncbi:MAG: type II secretion system protein [Moraxellaceae bacterium]|nr:MAG: type II secretion system protein [Moraxellaceae bacterium]
MTPLAFNKYPERGFTLIEVITVIVVLAILASMGGIFVVESTRSYQATQTRSRLVNTGRQALERMTRQLRVALPYSVRLTNSNMCLEFMPIASGGNYAGYVPDAVNGANPAATLTVSPHTVDFGVAQFLSIGAMAANELYGPSPASRATLNSRSNILLTFTPAKGWTRNSVNKRFYLLTKPQAFCIVGNQLRFYADQDATATSVDTTSAFSLLAENVSAPTPFTLTAGSENRNTVVQFAIAFVQGTLVAQGAESVTFNHSVMIRNVP